MYAKWGEIPKGMMCQQSKNESQEYEYKNSQIVFFTDSCICVAIHDGVICDTSLNQSCVKLIYMLYSN